MEIARRQAVRGILWSEAEQRLLLIRICFESGKEVWITPGGGRKADETAAFVLAREVREETGYEGAASEGILWHRSHDFWFMGKMVYQDEEFHLVPVARFDPSLSADSDAYEQEMFAEWRWWSIEEIKASNELFSPRELGTYMQTFVENGVPEHPPKVGV